MNYRLTVAIASAVLLGSMGIANLSSANSGDTLVAQSSPSAEQPQEGHRGGHSRGRHQRIDFTTAAAELNTTEAELKAALGIPENHQEERRERQARFEGAATQLGVTSEALREALGITLDPEGRPQRPRTRPDLAAAAEQLNVTEAELRAAFGSPEAGDRRGGRRGGSRPRLDIAGAAEQFGVSEAELAEILGIPTPPPGESAR